MFEGGGYGESGVYYAGKKFKVILRLRAETDPDNYKNSVLSFWHIGEITWRKSLSNIKILYKRIK